VWCVVSCDALDGDKANIISFLIKGYYHMGVIYTAMFLLGGMTNVYVTYMNEAKLFKLGEVDGHAKARRNGEWKTVPQIDLVPGDIISVEPGKCYCDMVVFEAGTILVDESGITGEVCLLLPPCFRLD
jgi:P-type E1-E2 ATPase